MNLRDRVEFLAILEFSVPVAVSTRGPHEEYTAVIPVPKCLDNSVRLQLLGDGEASVMAEPKILPAPLNRRESSGNLFNNASSSRRQIEDGWEDGEVPGAETEESSADEDGSWLEGRFPRYVLAAVFR